MKYDYLLKDDDVRRWHDNLSVIWGVALRILGRFCEHIAMSPLEFARSSSKEMADKTQDYIHKLLKETNPQTGKLYSPGYVDNCLTAIKSWAASQERPIIRKIRIENAQATPI